MRLWAILSAALLLAACAHPLPREVSWQEANGPREVEIVLRHGPDDDAAAGQVRRALRAALPLAERWGALVARLYVTIHPSHEALETVVHRPDHPWLRAWARVDSVELQSPRTWSRGEATDEELTLILAHELTHCVMFQAIGGDARLGRGIPVWFREGMATSSSGESFIGAPPAGDALTVTALLYQTDSSRVYATADQAFRFLVRRHGEDRVRGVLTRMREGALFADAFQEAVGVSVEAFEAEFRRSALQETSHG